MSDQFNLDRFVQAQDANDTYRQALAELRRGQKTGHWMWFVFPQLAGLGRSSTAQRYAISSVAEARAYLDHPILGHRLVEAAQTLLTVRGRTAEQLFGSIDAVKLRSSMTLFARADPSETVFSSVLQNFFGGVADTTTEKLIRPPD